MTLQLSLNPHHKHHDPHRLHKTLTSQDSHMNHHHTQPDITWPSYDIHHKHPVTYHDINTHTHTLISHHMTLTWPTTPLPGGGQPLLAPTQIDQVEIRRDIKVITYGLLPDFTTNAWRQSQPPQVMNLPGSMPEGVHSMRWYIILPYKKTST